MGPATVPQGWLRAMGAGNTTAMAPSSPGTNLDESCSRCTTIAMQYFTCPECLGPDASRLRYKLCPKCDSDHKCMYCGSRTTRDGFETDSSVETPLPKKKSTSRSGAVIKYWPSRCDTAENINELERLTDSSMESRLTDKVPNVTKHSAKSCPKHYTVEKAKEHQRLHKSIKQIQKELFAAEGDTSNICEELLGQPMKVMPLKFEAIQEQNNLIDKQMQLKDKQIRCLQKEKRDLQRQIQLLEKQFDSLKQFQCQPEGGDCVLTADNGTSPIPKDIPQPKFPVLEEEHAHPHVNNLSSSKTTTAMLDFNEDWKIYGQCIGKNGWMKSRLQEVSRCSLDFQAFKVCITGVWNNIAFAKVLFDVLHTLNATDHKPINDITKGVGLHITVPRYAVEFVNGVNSEELRKIGDATSTLIFQLPLSAFRLDGDYYIFGEEKQCHVAGLRMKACVSRCLRVDRMDKLRIYYPELFINNENESFLEVMQIPIQDDKRNAHKHIRSDRNSFLLYLEGAKGQRVKNLEAAAGSAVEIFTNANQDDDSEVGPTDMHIAFVGTASEKVRTRKYIGYLKEMWTNNGRWLCLGQKEICADDVLVMTLDSMNKTTINRLQKQLLDIESLYKVFIGLEHTERPSLPQWLFIFGSDAICREVAKKEIWKIITSWSDAM